jgi:hypothetical protein
MIDRGGILSIGKNANGEVVYGRTELGQTLYDALLSSMTAAECVRRHPGLSREFVLNFRKENADMREGKQWQNQSSVQERKPRLRKKRSQ